MFAASVWAADKTTRKPTSRVIAMIRIHLVSFASGLPKVAVMSSGEAELHVYVLGLL